MLLLMLISLSVWSQERTLQGNVTSEEDGEPLIGATVRVKGTTTGAITDANGHYSIRITDGVTLLFNYVGFGEKQITVQGQSTLDVALSPGNRLDEIVVTALGISREKKALGYAVQQVGGEELAGAREPNVLNALQGKVAGVLINSSSGAPGAGTNILIRGITSLDPGRENQPLFVIDGIPISNQTIAGNVLPSSGSNAYSSGEQASFSNRAVDINPNDIESINILKGPAGTALYGLRAANGVVIITTKKGKAGKARVNLTSSWGFDEVAKAPVFQTTYREGRFGRLRFNSDGSPLRFQSFGPKVYPGLTPVFDPIDLFQTGSRSDNNLSFSGGNQTARFHSSIGYSKQEGVIPNSEWDRLSARISGSIQISPKFEVGASVNFSRSGGNRPHSGDKSIMSSLSYYTTSFDINDYINPDGSMKEFSDGIVDNPRYVAEVSSLKDNVNRTIGNLNFAYKLTDWLKLEYRVGGDQYSDFRRRVVPPGLDLSSQTGGFIIEENIGYRELTSNLYATATKNWTNDLGMTFMVGHNLTDINYERLNARGESFTLPDFYDLSNTANYFLSKANSQYRLVGLFGQLGFSYRNMLYLEITGRNDWSSTLPVENRSFFYPAVNLSWVFSEMLSNQDILSYGKVRASWAQVGKDADPYNIGIFYNQTPGFPFGGVTGFTQNSVSGDVNLKPEQTSSIELGTELRFFQNRVGLDFAWFRSNSKDQILSVPVSNATGFSRFITNAGEIENTGIELLLNVTPVRRSNFEWTAGINFSKFSGEVIAIRDGIEQVEFFSNGYITNKLVPGGNVGDLYGYRFNYNDAGQLIIGSNGFPTVRTDTLVKVGNALPDFTAGLNNTFTWKGLSLGFLLEWRSGGDVMDMGIRNSIRNGGIEQTVRRYEDVIFNGVTATGEPNTVPVEINGETLYRSFGRYNSASEVVLEDASWFRIRRVSLSYRLPNGIGNIISGMRITLSGNNLLINTPFRGFDPETNYLGSGSNVFGFTGLQTPGVRSYNLSLDVNF